MTRLPNVGGDDGTWGDVLNDFLAQSHKEDGTLKADTVGPQQLKSNSVTAAAIASGSVSNAKIANGAVGRSQISNGAIDEDHLATDLRNKLNTSPVLADGSVSESKLDSAVRAKLNADVADGSITTAKLADGAVTVPKLHGAGQPDGLATLNSDARLPENQLPLRLSSEDLDARYGRSGPDIVIWGDSMSAPASGFGDQLKQTTTATIYNGAVGGETSTGIAARVGVRPYRLSAVGGFIPPQGSVEVTIISPSEWPLLQGSGVSGPQGNHAAFTGSLAGVNGTFSLTKAGQQWIHDAGDKYYFTRTLSGEVTPCVAQPWLPEFGAARRGDIHILCVGTNRGDRRDVTMSDIGAIMRYRRSQDDAYLVLSPFNGAGVGIGTSGYADKIALRDRLSAAYGARFRDVRGWLVSDGLSEAGIEPTAQDQTDIANDIVPTSLRTDSTHLNAVGKLLMANYVGRSLLDLGLLPDFTPLPYPAASTQLLTNPGFEGSLSGWTNSYAATLTRDTSTFRSGMASAHVAGATAPYQGLKTVPILFATHPSVLSSSAWVRAPAGTYAKINHHETNAAGGYIRTFSGTTVLMTGAWQELTWMSNVSGDAGGAILEVLGVNSLFNFNVDDASLRAN